MNDDRPDRIILAFAPSNDEYATEGHRWSLYNPSLENPYTVPGTDDKINRALELIDPHDYEKRDWEHWVRLDWQSVIDGEPERLEVEKPDYYDG